MYDNNSKKNFVDGESNQTSHNVRSVKMMIGIIFWNFLENDSNGRMLILNEIACGKKMPEKQIELDTNL